MIQKKHFGLIVVLILMVFCDHAPEGVVADASALIPATGISGMVSSAHPLATQAGLDILKAGGNAFDAAVAVASTLNVVEPAMSGIGGYGTILVFVAKEKRVRFLDSSGKIR
jgi:gamma-glutamyltranspeptidase/glutathione hydrolase